MSATAVDRTYWHVPGARSWHADGADTVAEDAFAVVGTRVACGRYLASKAAVSGTQSWDKRPDRLDYADRVPSNGHLCGSCARVIAARTDIE